MNWSAQVKRIIRNTPDTVDILVEFTKTLDGGQTEVFEKLLHFHSDADLSPQGLSQILVDEAGKMTNFEANVSRIQDEIGEPILLTNVDKQ